MDTSLDTSSESRIESRAQAICKSDFINYPASRRTGLCASMVGQNRLSPADLEVPTPLGWRAGCQRKSRMAGIAKEVIKLSAAAGF